MTIRILIRISISFIALIFITSNAGAQLSKAVGLLKADVVSSDGTTLPGVSFSIFKGVDKLTSTKSNSEGKISTILQPNATYRVAVTSSGYMYHEDTVQVPSLSAYQEFPLHIVLTPLKDGQSFDLPTQIFVPNSSDISSTAMPELGKIANELKHNQKLSVAVTVYPDAPVVTKKDAAQQKLVASRETSIRSYFLGKSISSERFSVESVTTTIPPGKFPPPPASAQTPAKSKKKKKSAAPAAPGLVPQYVEIVAHVAQ
jgi:outer membrane protein OmpA-like peptidoglycan-associated protein